MKEYYTKGNILEESEISKWNEKLKELPIFNMSLSSKELFHSNFIGWVLETYPNQMAKFFIQNTNEKITDVKREEKNIDLSFKIGDTLFIIENKVKSIAYKEQLNKYSGHEEVQKSTKVQCILLSLKSSTFFKETDEYIAKIDDIKKEFKNQKEIKKEISWKYISYKSLIEYFEKLEISENYHNSLINDYCKFLNIIDENIVQKIDFDKTNLINLYVKGTKEYNNLEILDKLRMHDFFQKGIFEDLANQLRIRLDDINNEVTITHGMTRATGLLDVKVNYADDIIIGIQIQGNQYRKTIEGSEKSKVVELALKLDEKIEDKEAEYFKGMLPTKPNKKLDKYDKHLSFNKYDMSKNLFLYKYIILKNLSNNDLISKILEDIQILVEMKKENF